MRAAVAVASLVSLFLAGGAGDAGTMGFPVVAALAILSAAVFFLDDAPPAGRKKA